MVKRSTWILLFILALLLSAYFLFNNRPAVIPAEETQTSQVNNYLITTADGVLRGISINDQNGNMFRMERDSSETWIVLLPSRGVADQGLAEAAMTQVGALRIISVLNNELNLADTGLVMPAFTINLTFTGGIKHVIQVGDLTPINNGYYIRLDEENLCVVGQAGIEALIGLIESPPFTATYTQEFTQVTEETPTVNFMIPESTVILPTPTP